MQLENTFTIAAPIDQAWEALNTPQTVAPCFPGATLQSYEGDSFTGTVKVKLGPISLTYKGKGVYKERDDAAHRVVIEASGRDSRGNGTANATVTGTMVAEGPDKTSVTMVTDMTITGRPAQFGRGVMSDVADKIIGQFAACVADKLALAEPSASDDPAPSPSAESFSAGATAAAPPAHGNGSGAAGRTGAAATETAAGPALSSIPSSSGFTAPTPMAGSMRSAIDAITVPARSSIPSSSGVTVPTPAATGSMRSEIDAIDLLDAAGAPVLKRLAPVLGGVLVILLLFVALRRRRRS